MCFRPSALVGNSTGNIEVGTCPSCGQPVAASAGVTSGTCPHCGNAIPVDAPANPVSGGSGSADVRIL